MKKLMALVIAVMALAGCASSSLLPQMQKWDTHDQILGGMFIAECTWDMYDTKRHVFDHPDEWEEQNPLVHNKSQMVALGLISIWSGLFGVDKLENARTPLLIFLNILKWGGGRREHKIIKMSR